MNNKYIISKKKIDLLYDVIYQEIMSVRITLCNLSAKELEDQVNDVLADLCTDAPHKAISIFEKTKNKK